MWSVAWLHWLLSCLWSNFVRGCGGKTSMFESTNCFAWTSHKRCSVKILWSSASWRSLNCFWKVSHGWVIVWMKRSTKTYLFQLSQLFLLLQRSRILFGSLTLLPFLSSQGSLMIIFGTFLCRFFVFRVIHHSLHFTFVLYLFALCLINHLQE